MVGQKDNSDALWEDWDQHRARIALQLAHMIGFLLDHNLDHQKELFDQVCDHFHHWSGYVSLLDPSTEA
jgi:hypothetical protein